MLQILEFIHILLFVHVSPRFILYYFRDLFILTVSEITLDAAKWLGAKAETDATVLKRKVMFKTNFIFK
jgi:hypothetical protein